MLLGAMFKRGELLQGTTCPLADRAVVGSNVQKRGGHISVPGREEDRNVHWRIGLSLEATRRAVAGRNIGTVEEMNGPWAL
jgi:hypothetical protein